MGLLGGKQKRTGPDPMQVYQAAQDRVKADKTLWDKGVTADMLYGWSHAITGGWDEKPQGHKGWSIQADNINKQIADYKKANTAPAIAEQQAPPTQYQEDTADPTKRQAKVASRGGQSGRVSGRSAGKITSVSRTLGNLGQSGLRV